MNQIPNPISSAAVSILLPYAPGLTPERLVNAISFQPEIQESLLSRKETAVALHVSSQTVDRMIKDGGLRSVKIRGRVMIPQTAIDALLSIPA